MIRVAHQCDTERAVPFLLTFSIVPDPVRCNSPSPMTTPTRVSPPSTTTVYKAQQDVEGNSSMRRHQFSTRVPLPQDRHQDQNRRSIVSCSL